MTTHPLFILSILALNVALSEWLVRRTWLRHLGSALLVIVLTAAAANLGLIPAYSGDIPIYAGVFAYVAPLRPPARPRRARSTTSSASAPSTWPFSWRSAAPRSGGRSCSGSGAGSRAS